MLIEKPMGAQRSAKVYDTQISGLQLNDPNPRHWDVGDEFKRMLSTSNFLTTEESLNFGLVVFIATLLSRFHLCEWLCCECRLGAPDCAPVLLTTALPHPRLSS